MTGEGFVPRAFRALVCFIALILLASLVISWPALQDDALIHLRYADHLLHQHMISYDGVTPSFGASSILYISLLAVLRSIFTSPLLPRIVSSLSHVLLFAGLAWAFARTLRNAPRLAWLLAFVLLGVLAVPSSVRWLDDGMETPLVLAITVPLAFAASRLAHSKVFSGRSVLGLAVLGFFIVLLRVELLLLLGVVSLALFAGLRSLRQSSLAAQAGLALRSFSLVFGGLVGAAAIVALTGHLLPDTALAKAFGIHYWVGTLRMSAIIFASSLAFGIVSLLLWILSLAALILHRRGISVAVLLINSLFPVTLFLAAIRGQAVQGIRYFEWTLFFPILWNILELRFATADSQTETIAEPAPIQPSAKLLSYASYALVACLVLSLPLEAFLFTPVFRLRARSLEQFRAEHLERLQPLKVVAFDVGYIGYFTGSDLCDMAGLVNGRGPAVLPYSARIQRCASERPDYAFLNIAQADDLNGHYNLSHWSICSEYKLANLRSLDVHYLVASPESTPLVCSATGVQPTPLAPLLGPPSDFSLGNSR